MKSYSRNSRLSRIFVKYQELLSEGSSNLNFWYYCEVELSFSTLQFFSELVLASFNEILIDIFPFEKIFRYNRILIE